MKDGGNPRRVGLLSLVAVALVLLPSGILAAKFLAAPASYSNWGDGAAAELNVQRAVHFDQLLGPYDRFGWNHPGPSSYYLLSVPYRLLGESGRALALGTAALNAIAGGWIVALVARRTRPRAALCAAGVLCGFQLALSLAYLGNVWNPLVVVLPATLALVLCADLASDGNWSLPGALAVVSFTIQTHIGTSAILLPALALAGGALLARRPWRTSSSRSFRSRQGVAILLTSAAVMLAFWTPPLIEQLTEHPGNATEVARYFRTEGGSKHSVRAAGSSLAKALLVLPARRHLGDDVSAGSRAIAFLLPAGLAAIAIGVLAWSRRQQLALALSVGAMVLAGFAWFAFTRVEGPIFGYLVLWASSLSVCLILALGLCVLDPGDGAWRPAWSNRWAKQPGAVVLGVAVGVVALFAIQKALSFRAGAGYTNVEAASAAASTALRGDDGGVLACIASADAWPSAAGVIANLRKEGIDVRVEPHWLYILGAQLRPRGRETTAVVFETVQRPEPSLSSSVSKHFTAGDLRMQTLRAGGAPVRTSVCPAIPN